ncbi:MAG TPA: hypothetical protein VJ884_01990 [Salinibacter sp.]|nr:hypothetical protein [Salinibacter sp.]
MPPNSSLPARFLLLALPLSLAGCLSFLHPGSVDRSMNGSYDQVFQATLEVLGAQGFPLKRVDRENGRIVTGRRPVQMGTAGRRVEKAEAYIEDDDGTVDVRLLLGFSDQYSSPPPRVRDRNRNGRSDDVTAAAISRSLDAGAVYDDYLDAIEKRVHALTGDSSP